MSATIRRGLAAALCLLLISLAAAAGGTVDDSASPGKSAPDKGKPTVVVDEPRPIHIMGDLISPV